MLSIALPAWLGLVAGAHHALSGPDHLAGVAPFAAERGRGAWRVGFGWGLGHACGALIAAAIALSLRARFPGIEASLSSWSEIVVGVVLCVVGALGLAAALRARAHEHDGSLHVHLFGAREVHARRGPFAVGMLHGAAGLSHLFAVLPALALPGVLAPTMYLGCYAVASLASITGVAMVVGRASAQGQWRRWWVGSASLASLVVGVWWLAAERGSTFPT